MKKLIILLLAVASTVMTFGQDKFCDPALAEEVNNYIAKNGGIWLKDFYVSLPKFSEKNKNPEEKYSIVLSADYIYRFILTSSPKYQGDAQLNIEDKSGKLVAILKTKSKNNPEASDIDIKATDTYTFKVNFLSGSEGCALFTICYVRKKT
jgi:hypothetical protein